MKDRGKIYLIDDDDLIVSMLSRTLGKEGYEVRAETRADDVAEKVRAWSPQVTLLDINIYEHSGLDILQEIKAMGVNTEIIMLTSDDTAETAVKAMKLGAADYITKPFNIDEVKIVIGNIIEKDKLKQEVDYLRKVNCKLFKKEIIGESSEIRGLKATIEKLVQARVSTILITGESGTGKELVARYIHSMLNGPCETKFAPFVGINCAALPETLLESELFGYEKGAFTDAKGDKKGLFEQANGGTLLLDEIGEMRLDLQSKLLRVLEERAVRRIGGKEEVSVNMSVIATTNRDIAHAVEKGDFRSDLFYRLNAFSLNIPPLRKREGDISLLARHFLSHFAMEYNKGRIKGFSPEAERLLLSYEWPGNVREMKNVIERIVVLENTETIVPEHLPIEFTRQQTDSITMPGNIFVLPEGGLSLDELEKSLIQQAIKRAKNNKTLAAKLLNITYDSLRYQIKKLGLEPE